MVYNSRKSGKEPIAYFAINNIVVKLTIVVSFICVCPVLDHEFRHNIVNVAADPRSDCRVDPQTTLTDASKTHKFIKVKQRK